MRRLLWACCCLCLVSCERNQYGGHPPHPVSGQLLVNGEPADGVSIHLFTLGEWDGKLIVPQGITDEDGRFKLSTYSMEDGAPAGEYEVAIKWPAYPSKGKIPDKLGEKFSDPKKSGIRVKIDETTTELPITLTAKIIEVKEPAKQTPVSTNNRRKNRRF